MFLQFGQKSLSSCLTCQCPCLTAQNKGDTPLRFTCCTTAPCSNRKSHTSIFPRPAAAVKAKERREEDTHADVRSDVGLYLDFYRGTGYGKTKRTLYSKKVSKQNKTVYNT